MKKINKMLGLAAVLVTVCGYGANAMYGEHYHHGPGYTSHHHGPGYTSHHHGPGYTSHHGAGHTTTVVHVHHHHHHYHYH